MPVAESYRGDVFMTLEGVAKNYAGTWVLEDASFEIPRGAVVALMGENGAGKSTLKNILCGLVAPNTGRIVVDGKEFPKLTVENARRLGIAAIHQELSLFPNLSIAENINIGVGMLPTRLGLLDSGKMRRNALSLLQGLFEHDVDPGQLVGSMSLGERQLVEVAKALHRASSMIIFDEPTTSLSLPERQRLFKVVKGLRDRGYAVIYITHFMEEVYELADRIVVLRDGRIVGQGTPAEIAPQELTRMMVGRELAAVDVNIAANEEAALAAPSKMVLKVDHLSDGNLLRDVSFELRAGEVLGLGGLMGAGRTEVAQAIFGLNSSTGSVEVDGETFEARSPERAKARGIALVSEDRRADQVFPGLSVYENLTSSILKGLTGRGRLLSRSLQRQRAGEMAAEAGVKHPGLDAPIVSLSGGNQQKCVIARWLATHPKICILDEPTKGIDVGAKAEVHLLVSQLAAGGLGVLLISSDLPELLALSHRILVMHKGSIVGEVKRADFDPGLVVQMASMGRAA